MDAVELTLNYLKKILFFLYIIVKHAAFQRCSVRGRDNSRFNETVATAIRE